MYSTVSPFGIAPIRWTWTSGIRWLTTGRLKASAMPATLSHWRDAADPHQIDHHDIDRARLHHVAERHDAPDVFAAGDRGRQRVGDPREPGIIVGRRHVLEPEQPDPGILDPAADIDRLLRPPALVDVAHQLDVGADRLADLTMRSTSMAGVVSPGSASCVFISRQPLSFSVAAALTTRSSDRPRISAPVA